MPLFVMKQRVIWFPDRMRAKSGVRLLIAHGFYVVDSVASMPRPVTDHGYDRSRNLPCIKNQSVVLPVSLVRIQGVSNRPFANGPQLLYVRHRSVEFGFGDPQAYRYPPISLEQTRHDCTTPECARNINTRSMAHEAWLSQADTSL